MVDLLKSIESQLGEEAGRLTRRLDEIEAERTVIEPRLNGIAEARKHLAEVIRQKERKGRSRASAKPSPTKADVLEAVMSLLADNRPAMPHDDLRSLAEGKIVERGLSRSVFGLMFKKALLSPEIREISPGLFTLAVTQGANE